VAFRNNLAAKPSRNTVTKVMVSTLTKRWTMLKLEFNSHAYVNVQDSVVRNRISQLRNLRNIRSANRSACASGHSRHRDSRKFYAERTTTAFLAFDRNLCIVGSADGFDDGKAKSGTP